MRQGVIAKLPERPDADGGEFGALWVIVEVKAQVGGRREGGKRNAAFDPRDELREQAGVGRCALALALRGAAQAAKERRFDARKRRIET